MRNKRLYNYIVNTFGLSKEAIMQVVENRVTSVIEKMIKNKLDSKEMERAILNHITKLKENGFYYNEPFDLYIEKVIRNILEEKMNKEYKLEVKAVQKEAKVIKRVKTRK